MAAQRRAKIRVDNQPTRGAGGDEVQMSVTLGASKDVPIGFANQLIMNYVGGMFYLTVTAVVPDAWTAGLGSPPPKSIEAKVLARFAIPIPQWVVTVKSFQDQIDRLTKDGVIAVQLQEVSEEGEGHASTLGR